MLLTFCYLLYVTCFLITCFSFPIKIETPFTLSVYCNRGYRMYMNKDSPFLQLYYSFCQFSLTLFPTAYPLLICYGWGLGWGAWGSILKNLK